MSVYGNIGSGIALNEMEALCTKKNMIVVGAATFIGEHSFSSGKAPVAECRPDASDLESAEEFGRNVYGKLTEADDIKELSVIVPTGRLPLMAKILPRNSARLFTKQPAVDGSTCTMCGVCVKVCPMSAIDEDTLEIKEELCLRCFACVRKCPAHSRKIDYKKRLLVTRFLVRNNRIRKEPVFYLAK